MRMSAIRPAILAGVAATCSTWLVYNTWMWTGYRAVSSDDTGLSDTERVYQHLKADILSGTLPPGTYLPQELVARKTEASRTPVREAFIMLAAKGLVQLTHHHGAKVSEISVHDFLEVNQLRQIIEGSSTRMATPLLMRSTIEEMQISVQVALQRDPVDPREVAEVDQVVHRTIAASCGNTRMARLIEEFNEFNALARPLDIAARHESVLQSLAALLDVIAAGNEAEAEYLMQQHIADFSTSWPSLLAASRARATMPVPLPAQE